MNEECMKATVIVTLKSTIRDPQGETIHRILPSIGIMDVTDLRQGKAFDIDLNNKLSSEFAREQVLRLAKEVLINQVIEEYRIIWD